MRISQSKSQTTISGGIGFRKTSVSRLLFPIALLVGIQLSVAQPASRADNSPENQTMFDGVSSLERSLGIAGNSADPMPQRLSVIEQKVFGSAQSGPLVGRVQHIKQTLETGPTSVPPSKQSTRVEHGVPGDGMPLINAIPPNFMRVSPPGTSPLTTEDYYSEVMAASHNKIFRFKQMPVPVFVNQFPDGKFTASVVKGFEVWEDMSSGAVRFVQVDDPAKARIQVAWKRLGRDQDGTGCALGAHTITKWTAKGKGNVSLIGVGGVPVPIYIPKLGPKYSVPPQIIEVNLDLVMSKNPSVRYRLLQNVVTHELGHALGIMGHSKEVNDMMYSVTDEHSRLSQRDVNTLIRIYKQKVDVPL